MSIGLASKCPDAPYIQEAERYGMPCPEKVECPECGQVCETIYTDAAGYAYGCDKCLKPRDAYDWFTEKVINDGKI